MGRNKKRNLIRCRSEGLNNMGEKSEPKFCWGKEIKWIGEESKIEFSQLLMLKSNKFSLI
jgi:hypothetical protein